MGDRRLVRLEAIPSFASQQMYRVEDLAPGGGHTSRYLPLLTISAPAKVQRGCVGRCSRHISRTRLCIINRADTTRSGELPSPPKRKPEGRSSIAGYTVYEDRLSVGYLTVKIPSTGGLRFEGQVDGPQGEADRHSLVRPKRPSRGSLLLCYLLSEAGFMLEEMRCDVLAN